MEQFNINKITSPRGLKKDQYDVVIIGAGIGGLVCGCYLAKAGLKVLIVEKNNKVGGYCQSFNVNDFIFDVGVHALEGVEDEETLGKVIQDLDLSKYVTFCRKKITDIFIFPDTTVRFFSNKDETLNEFKSVFDREYKAIDRFFKFLYESSEIAFFKFRDRTFYEVLNSFFRNQTLRQIFFALMRNTGVPSSKISAMTALVFLKKYIFEGGYYPRGGIQAFSDALLYKFKDLGGQITLKTLAKVITFDNSTGLYVIESDKGEKLYSKKIVCACDLSYAINYLLYSFRLHKLIFKQLKDMKTTLSSLITYVGLSKNLREEIGEGAAIWVVDNRDKDIDKEFRKVYSNKSLLDNKVRMIGFGPVHQDKGRDNLYIIETARYDDKRFRTDEDDNSFAYATIKEMESLSGLKISPFIEVIKMATPFTLYKYTLNTKGAIHGWSAEPKQISPYLIVKDIKIKDIYFVGHWVTGFGQGGIPWVVVTVFNVLKKILKNN